MDEEHPRLGGEDGRRRVLVACVICGAIASAGLYLALVVSNHAIGQPSPGRLNVFYVLFGRFEPPFVATQLGFSVVAIFLLGRASRGRAPQLRLRHCRAAYGAVLVFVLTLAGSRVVYHGVALSMDEFNAQFQAEILAKGRLTAQLPDHVTPVASRVTPTFVTFRSAEQDWLSSYLPVYAGLRALFVASGLTALVNPLLAALSILAVAALAGMMWPTSALPAGASVILLGMSSQFLATAMSGYSMPAHLLLNLTWLLLYLRADRRAQLAVPWIGVLAMGLHNPFPHALFAAPFVVRLARQRQWRTVSYYGAVYALGVLAWWQWLRVAHGMGAAAVASTAFSVPGIVQLGTQLMNWAMLLSWQTPVAGVAALVAVLGWRNLTALQRDLALGLVGTLLFCALLPFSQGHGWGNRYSYAVLGNLVLLAVTGLEHCRGAGLRRDIMTLCVISMVATIGMQLPMRALQIESFVLPWARAHRYVGGAPYQTVVVPIDSIWYGRDLVRNDPFLAAGPLVVASSGSNDALELKGPVQLCATSVLRVTACDLVRLGLVGYPGACTQSDEAHRGRADTKSGDAVRPRGVP